MIRNKRAVPRAYKKKVLIQVN